METIKEAQEYLNANAMKGCDCPVCEQRVQFYKLKIHSSMARSLVYLYKLAAQDPNRFYHISQFNHQTGAGDTGISKIRHWGCCQQQWNEDKTKRRSGMWKITDTGIAFVENRLALPKYRLFYNQDSFDYEGDDQHKIFIVDAFKDPFDYSELMRGGEDANADD